MTKDQIQAEINKVQSNKFLPQAVKDLKIKKLNEQLSQAEPAKKGPTIIVAKPGVSKKDFLEKYTGDVTDALENLLDASRSDAQGVAEANAALIEKEYEKGTDAVITAGYIVKKSEKGTKESKGAAKGPKPSKTSNKLADKLKKAVSKLIGELTDISIDLEGEDETAVAGLRSDLEEIDWNERAEDIRAGIDEDIVDRNYQIQQISDEKATKEIGAAITSYYIAVSGKKGPKLTADKKPKKAKVEYKYKGRTIKELTKEDCDELAKEIRERRQKQKKAEKKSKSKPVIEKIAKNVATAVKQAVKNVSASDIKDDPKKELDKMARIEAAAKEFLAKLRGILGEDYDKDAIEGEFKEVHDLIKGLKSKYGK